jgi:hypothetical protein
LPHSLLIQQEQQLQRKPQITLPKEDAAGVAPAEAKDAAQDAADSSQQDIVSSTATKAIWAPLARSWQQILPIP